MHVNFKVELIRKNNMGKVERAWRSTLAVFERGLTCWSVEKDENKKSAKNRNAYLRRLKETYMKANAQKKIDRRVAVADKNIEILHPPRAGKKLLMLDIDYTFFDHKSSAENGDTLTRPFLHEMLSLVYPHYDIGIWSATSRKWIDLKLQETGVWDHPDYNISVIMDYRSMVSTYVADSDKVSSIKPLGVLWQYSKQVYNESNTIMFDDLVRNFVLNPSAGLRIRPFKNAPVDGHLDSELEQLTDYLLLLTEVPDFRELDHRKWRYYVQKKRQRISSILTATNAMILRRGKNDAAVENNLDNQDAENEENTTMTVVENNTVSENNNTASPATEGDVAEKENGTVVADEADCHKCSEEQLADQNADQMGSGGAGL